MSSSPQSGGESTRTRLKQLIAKAGFELLPNRGKGSHSMWRHPQLTGDPLIIPGKDGDDAPRYLEKQVMQKLDQLNNSEDGG